MKQPKVSMVIPCYNKAPYIGEMLQSVYNQVWDNIEVILVNDGSTDGTREIIVEWEPKLRERGYEVSLIDQVNQGVAAAVRNGLLRVTGEYVCFPDCDDLLDAKYVAVLAGELQTHDDIQWVSCSALSYNGEKYKTYVYNVPVDSLAEQFIFFRISTAIWIYMVRHAYIAKCEIVQNFVVEPGVSQESQIYLQLAAGKGKQSFLSEALYVRRTDSVNRARVADFSKTVDFVNQYFEIEKQTIKLLRIADEGKNRFMYLSEIANMKILCQYTQNFDEQRDHIIEWVSHANSVLNANLHTEIAVTEHTSKYSELFFRAMEISIFQETSEMECLQNKISGKIIAYGALGKNARRYLPLLYKTRFAPEIFWDEAADESFLFGDKQVSKPEFQDLNDGDILLVFPSNPEIRDWICKILGEKRCCKYFDIDEIKKYLALCNFNSACTLQQT